MYKGNKEREAARRNKGNKLKKDSVLTNDTTKIPKSYETPEKNGIENLAFQSN